MHCGDLYCAFKITSDDRHPGREFAVLRMNHITCFKQLHFGQLE